MEHCVVVQKEKSQILRQILEREELWDGSRRLRAINTTEVAIPVLCQLKETLNADSEQNYHLEGISFRIDCIALGQSKKVVNQTPREKLVGAMKSLVDSCPHCTWSDGLLRDLPVKWEQHGDMIVLPEHCFLSPVWQKLTDQLWPLVAKSLGVCRLAKRSVIKNDDFRTPKVSLLVGEDSLVTHTDNGIKYTFDVTRNMFSAGNVSEKLRVAGWDCRGQTVVDLYAGIGYFTLPYLVHAGASLLYACEWNPAAVSALRRNLALNGVAERCVVLPGDNRKVCPVGVADHVNLGLIPSSEPSWRVACLALRPETGGTLHIHGNVTLPGRTQRHGDSRDGSQGVVMDGTNEYGNGTDELEQSEDFSENSEEKSAIKECVQNCETNSDSDKNNKLDKRKTKMCKFMKTSKHHQAWDDWATQTSATIKTILCEIHAPQEWDTRVLHIEHVKSYAPRVDHLVLDLKYTPHSVSTE